MKYLLILIVVFCGCKGTRYEPKNDADKIRYFFVGYDVNTPEFRSVGNFYNNGVLLNVDSLTNIVYRMFKCDKEVRRDQCIITSIFEFKDSSEYMMFKNGRGNYIFDCDSIPIFPTGEN